MKITFTISDLKSDPRWVLEHVRKGGAANIACDGEIVAEIRPLEPRKYTMERRMKELRHRGVIRDSGEPKRPIEPVVNDPGALAQFLAEREAGYLDTSAILSITFGESGWETVTSRLSTIPYRMSFNLLEAEVRAAFARSRLTFNPDTLSDIRWRSLSTEFERVLEAGYLRGADLWHVATALYIFDDPSAGTFLTLDHRQAGVTGQ